MEFNVPEPLILTGDVAENFKKFKDEVGVFFEATGTTTESEKTQVTLLLILMGVEARQVYGSFNDGERSVRSIFKILENHCSRRNEVMEQYRFFTRNQNEDEKFAEYYAELRNLIKTCNFGDLEDGLLRTQIIVGVANKELQTSLLREELNLNEVVELCQAVARTEEKCNIMEQERNKVDVAEKFDNPPRDARNDRINPRKRSTAKKDEPELIAVTRSRRNKKNYQKVDYIESSESENDKKRLGAVGWNDHCCCTDCLTEDEPELTVVSKSRRISRNSKRGHNIESSDSEGEKNRTTRTSKLRSKKQKSDRKSFNQLEDDDSCKKFPKNNENGRRTADTKSHESELTVVSKSRRISRNSTRGHNIESSDSAEENDRITKTSKLHSKDYLSYCKSFNRFMESFKNLNVKEPGNLAFALWAKDIRGTLVNGHTYSTTQLNEILQDMWKDVSIDDKNCFLNEAIQLIENEDIDISTF